jgi:transglutaminase-like putative cysteine protease
MRLSCCLLALTLVPATFSAEEEAPRERTFQFTYGATLTGLPAGEKVRVWLPVPPSDSDQKVVIVSKKLPAEGTVHKDPKTGNRFLYFEAKAGVDGKLPFEVVYRVQRKELKGPIKDQASMDELARFLQASSLVPIGGKPLELVEGKKLPADPVARARVFYDVVNGHMKYDKSRPGWGRGDAAWACQSGYGNCTDFHSLFISLARSSRIPAKFEIGFGLPAKRGKGDVPGYHCWAKFRPDDRGWVGVDISEANKNPKMKEYYFGNLTEDRVAFSQGRDLTLVPRQAGKPVNFLVYPYAEVDGKPWPQEKISKHFHYEDQSR